jgi:hypothetical protein
MEEFSMHTIVPKRGYNRRGKRDLGMWLAIHADPFPVI